MTFRGDTHGGDIATGQKGTKSQIRERRHALVSEPFVKMNSPPYSNVPSPSSQPTLLQYAPRPHRCQSAVSPPPKMDKTLFDRCGNCTRAFGFLSRKVSNCIQSITISYDQRHCANCGFVYCSDCCTEKFKLVKFQGLDSRDVRVCDYCKDFLKSIFVALSYTYRSRSNATPDIAYHVGPFAARIYRSLWNIQRRAICGEVRFSKHHSRSQHHRIQ